MKRTIALIAPVLAGLAFVQPVLAADHEIKMLNQGPTGSMVFDPPILKIAPGDSVTFVPTDKGHNAESIPGMAPDGAAPFKGVLGKPVTVTFTAEGIYGYKCLPHYGMGMVGIIKVGNATPNIDAAKSANHPGKARTVMADLLTKAGEKTTAAK